MPPLREIRHRMEGRRRTGTADESQPTVFSVIIKFGRSRKRNICQIRREENLCIIGEVFMSSYDEQLLPASVACRSRSFRWVYVSLGSSPLLLTQNIASTSAWFPLPNLVNESEVQPLVAFILRVQNIICLLLENWNTKRRQREAPGKNKSVNV